MASGDLLATIFRSVPPASNPATQDLTSGPFPVYDYDDTTSETMYFMCYMSGVYDGTSSINVILPWKFTTYVGSQTCDWEVSFYRVGDDTDSIDSFTFAAAQTSIVTEASATGELDYATIAFTNAEADGIQPNELFVLRVTRDAAGGTASPGDAELTFPIIEQA